VTTPTAGRAALAQAVAAGVIRVPGVVRLSAGAGIEVATLYPGGKVVGVKVTDHRVAVHIVADRLPLPVLGNEVRAAARAALVPLGFERPVDVVIEALDLEELPLAAASAGGRPQVCAVRQRGR
jgi:hypothetical protein